MENKDEPSGVDESGRTRFFKTHIDMIVELECLRATLDAYSAHKMIPPANWRESIPKMKQAPRIQALYQTCSDILHKSDRADLETIATQLAALPLSTKTPN
jgi:hypothetical protein